MGKGQKVERALQKIPMHTEIWPLAGKSRSEEMELKPSALLLDFERVLEVLSL